METFLREKIGHRGRRGGVSAVRAVSRTAPFGVLWLRLTVRIEGSRRPPRPWHTPGSIGERCNLSPIRWGTSTG